MSRRCNGTGAFVTKNLVNRTVEHSPFSHVGLIFNTHFLCFCVYAITIPTRGGLDGTLEDQAWKQRGRSKEECRWDLRKTITVLAKFMGFPWFPSKCPLGNSAKALLHLLHPSTSSVLLLSKVKHQILCILIRFCLKIWDAPRPCFTMGRRISKTMGWT